MEVICTLLIAAIIIIVVLFSQLSYKNYCIENNLSNEAERKNKDFERLLKLASEEYAKKELNIDTTNENV